MLLLKYVLSFFVQLLQISISLSNIVDRNIPLKIQFLTENLRPHHLAFSFSSSSFQPDVFNHVY